ncbi:hypothetical protein K6119_05755 [Paracrocinitomix mangrovi]|uniref:hypothetical protein n=1 Tax=Paracrocinitomix mangrovi TaxID=2862509 RepID=UPI001C8D00A7|nr:hypothetical protein [Paracrocinitomix mangrovi]UKN03019.1 hypothetical protein K6119_05755 [Paracrocinitomix mangrovi]
MEYRFELTHKLEHYRWQNGLLFEYFNKRLIRSGLIVFGGSLLLILLSLSKGNFTYRSMEMTFVFFGIFYGLILFYIYFKALKVYKNRLAELEPGYSVEPQYEVWLNDKKFGSKDYYATVEYSWSKHVSISRYKGLLIIQVYPRSQHLIVITEKEVGADKLKEIEKFAYQMKQYDGGTEVV